MCCSQRRAPVVSVVRASCSTYSTTTSASRHIGLYAPCPLASVWCLYHLLDYRPEIARSKLPDLGRYLHLPRARKCIEGSFGTQNKYACLLGASFPRVWHPTPVDESKRDDCKFECHGFLMASSNKNSRHNSDSTHFSGSST